MTEKSMIEVRDLIKHYGEVHAICGVSFQIQRGEVVGLLGPNGAGKTTTMKILTGYLAPTSGGIFVGGMDAYEHGLACRNLIGYLPEHNPLYPELVVYDFLRYVGDLRGLSKSLIKERIETVGRRCGLQEVIGRAIGELSKGFRQRVGLAQALLHDPPVLILDEPTSGLDPNQIVEIRELIRELGKDHTVILSTHNLPEVMQVCNRIIIMHRGSLVADGSHEELVNQAVRDPAVILEVANDGSDAVAIVAKIKSELAVQSVEQQSKRDSTRLRIRVNAGKDIRTQLFDMASEQSWPLLELHRDAPDLEQIFQRLTQE
jgi:ABC-2 type transport system ATP-binding protein